MTPPTDRDLVLTRLIFEWMYFRGDEPKSMSV